MPSVAGAEIAFQNEPDAPVLKLRFLSRAEKLKTRVVCFGFHPRSGFAIRASLNYARFAQGTTHFV